MIKMIASDMDGTLLDAKMQISESNISAIREAERHNIIFMVATGRGLSEAKPALDEAGITCPMITVNGAQAFDQHGNELFTIGIEKATAKAIIDLLTKHQVYFEIATNQGVFSDNLAQRLENIATMLANQMPHLTFKMALTMAAAHLEQLPITNVKDYQIEVLDNPQIEVLKFIVFHEKGPQVLDKIAEEISVNKDLIVSSSFPNNIEINHIEAQKGIAVKRMAKKLGIDLSQVMTIGDNLNDLSMLEVAGVSFAMGNGEEAVKKTAKYTTATNLENGVGQAIIKAITENL